MCVDPAKVDAANEKACIEALKKLISKADAEIAEIEEEIILLQSQIACCTDEAWAEMCFDVLNEKISSLEKSIKESKNKNTENQQEAQPSERLHEILKSLLEKHFLHKDEQVVLHISSISPPCSP